MDSFLKVHAADILGTLSTFDRLVFKGHLTQFFPEGRFSMFLARQGVLLKEFKPYVQRITDELKAHALRMAEEAGRPFMYLASATTKRQGSSKEDLAREIAERDGIREGLVCVFSVLEPCRSFTVQGNRATKRLEVVRKARKCLHFYFYFIDPEFGLMHVRLQSWFPFEIQVWINGREWLAQELDRRGIGYERLGNTFLGIDDLAQAERICEQFARRRWPRVLNALARRVNPMLAVIRRARFGGYYWVVDQAEYATDVMFRDRRTLEAIYPSLVEHATTAFGADDILRFLGRKLHGNFRGEATSDLKRRTEGWRIKHRMKQNSLKMYDKGSVLRVETTINNPREFRVLRVLTDRRGRRSRRWAPMNKGVANLWRFAQVALQANTRYLEALAYVQPKGEAIDELDGLCRSRVVRGTRYARFNPVEADTCALFEAVLHGDHTIRGFRNRDLQSHLYSSPPRSKHERRRRSEHTSRKIAKLRGHGLVRKVKDSRLYRPTPRGLRLMTAAVQYRKNLFPLALMTAA
jgi:hypothetical protein